MAFCTNCGRKLNPGEICICQQQKGAVNGQKAGQQIPGGQMHQPGVGQQIPYNQGMPNQQMYYQKPKPKLNFDIQAMAMNFLQILLKPKSVGRAFVKEANIITAFIFIA